jgi:anhydro-N-acetylmuramic acid kinase
MLSIGLMSGTSMDGIDAALLETNGEDFIKDLGMISIPYDPEFKILLKTAEYAIKRCLGNIQDAKTYYSQTLQDYLINELKISENDVSNKIKTLAKYFQQLNKSLTLDEVIFQSTMLHVLAVKKLLIKTGYQAQQIDVIGYHGQTMLHQPTNKVSIIMGDGQALANQLGITVVNNFRSRDIAMGGQGAPFAPLYHRALAIQDQKIPSIVVNCGGIANLTLIQNENENDLIAFDTGPGNGLIDKLIRQRTCGQENMDTDGKYGTLGKVHDDILKVLYEKAIFQNQKNYFSLLPPKSLDIGDMELLSELDSLSLNDACRTLEAFTADTIVNSLKFVNTNLPTYWILAGGGWLNPVIRYELEIRLKKAINNEIKISTANEIGWNSQAMEAQVFAYLAVRSLKNKILSIPKTTGISTPSSGGHAYLPPIGATEIVKELIKKNPAVLSGYRT